MFKSDSFKPGLNIKAHRRLDWRFWTLLAAAIVVLLGALAGLWYLWALQPRDVTASEHHQRVVIESGDTATAIANKLQASGIIRSALAMRIYTELSGTRDKLRSGGYLISSSESVPQIVDHMVSGRTDEFNLTILAGLTLQDLQQRLEEDGYSRQEIVTALNKDYQHPLLVDKPAGASLEGYIYPETYRVSASSGLEQLFERSFDELYQTLKEEGLLTKFQKRGINLHQALTLASIVQMEVSDPADQKKVAQVFYKRLKMGMPLGSDPTFKYAAQLHGVPESINIDSPYNTRKVKGLPPGPIATMELSALQAVADPAKTDYLYFVSGDDGRTHFSKTLQQHEANTQRYCTTLCQ